MIILNPVIVLVIVNSTIQMTLISRSSLFNSEFSLKTFKNSYWRNQIAFVKLKHLQKASTFTLYFIVHTEIYHWFISTSPVGILSVKLNSGWNSHRNVTHKSSWLRLLLMSIRLLLIGGLFHAHLAKVGSFHSLLSCAEGNINP